MYDQVVRKIEALNSEYLKIWEDVCNLESPTEDKAGVDAVGHYFTRIAENKGWYIEQKPFAKAGDVICITMNPAASKGTIAISGHLDTVHPKGSFGSPAVTWDKEKFYGPGVYDCKGGIVAAVLAMDALTSCGFTERTVQLLLQTDEEVNCSLSQKDSIRYICEKASGAEAFLNVEVGKEGTACIARKGILRYRFTVNGISAHASLCSTEGANAIAEASAKILELEKMKNPEGITCSCGVIQGGTVVNVVPSFCTFEADVRFFTSEQKKQAEEQVRKIADNVLIPGCTCELEEVSLRPAMEVTDRNLQLLNRMNRIYKSVGLSELKGEVRTGGSDAAYVTEQGIPCVDSVGVSGGNLHSKDEYAYIRSLEETAKRLAAVVYLWDRA